MTDYEEAGGIILGLFFGGLLLIMIQSNLTTDYFANMALWGYLFILVAILLGVIVIVTIVSNIFK